MKILKAIIPAGGIGTRMLPVTKSIPKELLPINMKPMIQYAVEEAIKSGIKELLFVIRKDKDIIKHYFASQPNFKLKNRKEIKNLNDLIKKCKFHFAYQKEAKGLMDAISLCKDFVNNEPFAVLLPDNIMISRTPCIKQLIDTFYKNKKYSYIILKKFTGGIDNVEVDIGCIESELISKTQNVFQIHKIKKKNKNLIILDKGETGLKNFGRYVFTEEVFDYIKYFRTEYRGEFDDTPILNKLAMEGKLRGKLYNGIIFDTGNKNGFNSATRYFI